LEQIGEPIIAALAWLLLCKCLGIGQTRPLYGERIAYLGDGAERQPTVNKRIVVKGEVQWSISKLALESNQEKTEGTK